MVVYHPGPEKHMTSSTATTPLTLILHIGAGKTGTTSIQDTLKRHGEALRAQGVWYLGLMLEHAAAHTYAWQQAAAAMPVRSPEMSGEVRHILDETLSAAQTQGIHTLVWSNEQFFHRAEFLVPLLQEQVAKRNLTVKVISYVRRHDLWARSAYMQWGIKHKAESGAVRPFSDWISRHPPVFAPALTPWVQSFPQHFLLRNFDAAGDTLVDFCKALQLPEWLYEHPVRANESLSAESTYLRALFNSQYNAPVLPKVYQRVIGSKIEPMKTPNEYLNKMLPNQAALKQVQDRVADDRVAVNALLMAQGQPALSTDTSTVKTVEVHNGRLLGALCQLVMQQSVRIDHLEAQLNALKAAAKDA